ncbi:Helicase associated domain protein [Peribacillus sp. SCS-155]|uniref:Helicase associated domain protein n=1 Tax=Peribacillus sedimenti TaxID=3115297 RepID=UPI00390629E3
MDINIRNELMQLTHSRNITKIKQLLENLPKNIKGDIFEHYVEELYKGNGWLTYRSGKRGDKGGDILLYHPDEPTTVSIIIQVKNHKSPLNLEQTKSELIKFEDEASNEYCCNQFLLISISGFVKNAHELSKFNMRLEEWSYIENLIRNYSPLDIKKPEIQLYAHNKLAYREICKKWTVSNRVVAVQATGTGKSFLIIKTLADATSKNKLVLAPSKYILSQIKNNALWASKSTKYITYSKAIYLTDEEIKELNPSLIILDEFHRCGAVKWGRGVKRILEVFNDVKILGTSATPIRYLDENRDMSDELFNKNEAVSLSLAEAIVSKILPMPKYISALYTLEKEMLITEAKIKGSFNTDEEKDILLKQIDTFNEKWEKSKGIPNILKKHIPKGTHKFIVFCKDKEHLYEMEWLVESWFQKAGIGKRVKKYRVISGEPYNQIELEEFKNSNLKEVIHLLFSIDMINEGLHIKDISGVILLRNTISPTVFYQQIGRAIQVGSRTNPIIFDLVNNFNSIKSGNFLYDLKEANEKIHNQRKCLGLKNNEINFTIYDETKKALELFSYIEERLIQNWDIRLKQLYEYKSRKGHCQVSKEDKEYVGLGEWVSGIRKSFKNGKLNKEKVDTLNSIGFVWNTHDEYWEQMYTILLDYISKYGHCLVPKHSIDYKSLGIWVRTQRNHYKNKTLDINKVTKLNDIGFVWDNNQYIWDKYFSELVEEMKNNNGNVTKGNKKELIQWVQNQRNSNKKGTLSFERKNKLEEIGFIWDVKTDNWDRMFKQLSSCINSIDVEQILDEKLNSWMTTQRATRKKGKLSEQRIAKLDSIGFSWDVLYDNWDKMYKSLVEYKEVYGDCLVPNKSKSYRELALWVLVQRRNYKLGTLSDGRYNKLQEIDFSWEPNISKWEEMYRELKVYKEQFGDCLVLRSNKDYSSLGDWVHQQRFKHQKGKLTNEEIIKLSSLGFIWNVYENQWMKMYNELKEYEMKYGNCNVPQSSKDYKELGAWVSRQRKVYKQGKLDLEKVKKLEDIKFSWNLR